MQMQHGGVNVELSDWEPFTKTNASNGTNGATEPHAEQENESHSALVAFKSVGELEQGEVRMLIDQILPEGIIFVGGLSESAKSWLCISMAKALTTGKPFLGKWNVAQPVPVLYLCPESGDRSFGSRLRKMGIPDDRAKFLCRTANDITLALNSPEVLEAVIQLKCAVIVDTFVRFNGSLDENSSAQNQEIVKQVQALIAAGAPVVILIHHSPKSQSQISGDDMTLENVLRGSGDIGAAADVVYGLKTIDRETNESQVVCVKARDIERVKPFNIVGRPFIDETGDFKISVQPGEKRELPTVSKALLLTKCERILSVQPGASFKYLADEIGLNFSPKPTRDEIRHALDYGFWSYDKSAKKWTKG
jgi:hypothetical protein